MATQVKDSREDRVAGYVTALTDLTVEAEKVKDAPKPVADFVKKVNGFVSFVESMNGDGFVVLDALTEAGEDMVPRWVDTLDALKVFGALSAKGEGPDREAGDSLAKKLSGLIDADLVDEDESEAFAALVARWRASAPKGSGSKGSGSGSKASPKPLGFTVKVKCEHAGCDWSTSTSTDNLNSVRDLALNKHARKAHGFTGSTEISAGLTAALAAVGFSSSKHEKGSAATTQGGGFLVTR